MWNSDPPPAAPDPYRAASAQTGSNVNTAIANSILGNANQYGPTGSTTFTQNGNFNEIDDGNGATIRVPQFDQRTTLSPEQQRIYDLNTGNQTRMQEIAGQSLNTVGNILGSPIDASRIPSLVSNAWAPQLQTGYDSGGDIQKSVNLQTNLGLDTNAPKAFGQTAGNIQYGMGNTAGGIQYDVGAEDFSADRDKVEGALMARLQPQMDRDRAAMSARLANQGIAPGSEAYNQQMSALDRSATDARMQAILAGGQEQSRLFGMDVTKGQFANQAQAQDFGQLAARQAANNSAQGQDYNQLLGRGQFEQAGIGLNNAARATQGQFNNAAQLGMGQFANAAQGQQNSQNAQQSAFSNAAYQQMFQDRLQNAALNNQTSAQSLQQMLALRQAPLNEITALMNGSQVSMPQVNAYQGGQVAGTDVMGSIYNSAAINNQNYQTQQQQNNAMMGGLMGLGGSLLTGGMMGGTGGFANSMFGQLLGGSR